MTSFGEQKIDGEYKLNEIKDYNKKRDRKEIQI
jgi:hypothetical protein